MVETTSKSKSHKAADVTLTTAGLTFLDDEMFQSIVDEKGTTIEVQGNFPDEFSEMTREEVVSSFYEQELSDEFALSLIRTCHHP